MRIPWAVALILLLPSAGAVAGEQPISGVWTVIRDDDSPEEDKDETMYLYPDGSLRIEGKPFTGVSYRLNGDQFEMILDLGEGPKVVGSRAYLLEGDTLKLKNEKVGYVHYARLERRLPPLGGSSAEPVPYRYGPIEMQKPGDWETAEKSGAMGSQAMLYSQDGTAMLMVTYLLEDMTGGVDLGVIAREIALSLAREMGVEDSAVETVSDGTFHGMAGSHTRFTTEEGGHLFKVAVKTISLDQGQILGLASTMLADSPAEALIDAMLATLKVNGKALE